jgi:hypothetical protein
MSTAVFVTTDTTTLGSWIGVYGALGYYKLETAYPTLVDSLPSGVTVTLLNSPGTASFANGTTVAKDLQRVAAPTLRDADAWRSSTNFSFRITPSDGTVRRVYLYFRDHNAQGMNLTVAIKDHTAGTVYDTKRIYYPSLLGAIWYAWDISGDVDVLVTNTSGDTGNLYAENFGLFFDTAASTLLQGPPNLTGGLSTTAVLSWLTAGSGTGTGYTYDVQQAPDSSGSPGTYANVSGLTGLSGTTATVTGLTTGTKVWFRIVAHDSGSNTANSSGISYTPTAYAYIDNTDPGCTVGGGGWTVIGSWPTQTYGPTFLYGQNTSATATYLFTGLIPGVPVTIASTWYHDSGTATAAPFKVYDSNGSTLLATWSVNQSGAPTSDWTNPGDPESRPFQILGTATPSGTSLSVEILADSGFTGTVVADCVSIRQLSATSYTLAGPSSGTVNAASTNFTVTPVGGVYTGTITPASSGAGTFSPASLTWSGTSSAQTFTYTPTSTTGSPHSVSTTASPALGSNPSAVSYTVTPPLAAGTVSTASVTGSTLTVSTTAATGGTTPYTYQFQRAPDSSGSPGSWANVGSSGTSISFNDTGLTASTTYWYRVHVTDALSASVNSSSVSVTTATVYAYAYVDNTDPGCTVGGGGWTVITSWPTQTYGPTFLYGQNTSATATYLFTGLIPGVPVTIASTWYHDSSTATAAPFKVYDSNGSTLLYTWSVNQRSAPTSDWTNPGDPQSRPFQILGTATPSGTSLSVEILADSGFTGTVVADCVSIRQSVPSAATGYTLTGPSPASGNARVASGNFIVTPTGGPFTGTITPHTSSTGSFSPAFLTWYSESPAKTFTYTPVLAAGSPHQVTTTNTGSLTDPSAIGYTVNPFSPLTRLATWEANQIWQSAFGYADYSIPHVPYGDGPEHYDVPRVYQNIRDYRTANSLSPTNWDAYINAALSEYRDQMVLAWGGNLQFHHRYSVGTGRHYYETGNIDSRDAVMLLDDRNGAAFWLRVPVRFDGSREMAFALLDAMERERLGQSHQQVTEAFACFGLQCIDQWLTAGTTNVFGVYMQSFMVGLTMESLIAYWQRYQGDTDTTALDPTWPGTVSIYNTRAKIVAAIPGKIKAMIDFMWTNTFGFDGSGFASLPYMWPDPPTYSRPVVSLVGVSGGTTTSFVGGSELSSVDGYYNNCNLIFYSATPGFVGPYMVASYTGSTRTFTVPTYYPFSSAPTLGQPFAVFPPAYDYETPCSVTGSPTTSSFTANALNAGLPLSAVDGQYTGHFIVFLSGALATAGNIHLPSGYTGSTHTFAFSPALSQAPSPGDVFVVMYPSGTAAISSDLNSLVQPAYAWYYWYTANVLAAPDTSYRDKHDVLFDLSVPGFNFPYSQKLYNQTYRWSPDGLKWRARGDTEWTAATAYTFTAPSSTTGQANAPSGRFQVALPAITSVAAPVTVTYHSSTGRGTFIPATSVLTSVQPTGLFRFFPDPADASTGVTLTTTNNGGLTNPTGIAYTVGTAATIATGYTITGPSSGAINSPATFTLQTVPSGAVFSVARVQAGGGIDVIQAWENGSAGPFNMPNPGRTDYLWNSSEKLSQTFTYTPASVGTKALMFRDTQGLPEVDISFNAHLAPPVVASASVNAAGTTLTITFTETGSPPVLPASGATGFTLSASLGAVTLAAPSISGTTYTATISRAIRTGETLTLAYAPGNVTDSAISPNAMVTFSGTSVTNNSTQAMPSTATVSGPSSGNVSTESTAFTVTLNVTAPPGGTVVSLASTGSGDVFHATTGGGTVSSITVASGQTVGYFYLVPGTTGARTVTPTASGITFSPTTLSYTSNAVAATSYTLAGPSSAVVGSASTNFTVTTVGGVYTGTITPQANSLSGTFSPTSLTWSGTSAAQTFTFTPSASGGGTVSTTASPALGTDPTALSFTANPVLATSYTLTGPSSAVVGSASINFTVTPVGGVYTGTITPHASALPGTFSPTSLTWSGTSAAQTFTFTPSASGGGTISTTASPALGTDPTALSFTANPVLAISYTLTGPATGTVGSASTNFTLVPNGPYTGTITPSDGGAGTFSPASLSWAGDASAKTFTYTPASAGTKTITTTSQPALSNPSPVTYTALLQATGYTLAAPSPASGPVGTASAAFTVALSPAGSAVAAPVVVTPSASGAGGTFTLASVTLSTGTPVATFSYTPVATGTLTIACSTTSALSNPPGVTYTSIGGVTKPRFVPSRSYRRFFWGR